MYSFAAWKYGALKCLRAHLHDPLILARASTILRPSHGLWLVGFST